MRLRVHLGPDGPSTRRMAGAAMQWRAALAECGVLVPRLPGGRGHTGLAMAALDNDHVDPLRHARGHGPEDRLEALRETIATALADQADAADEAVLCMPHAATSLTSQTERTRLIALLEPLGADATIVLHLAPPHEALLDAFCQAVLWGRHAPLSRDLDGAAMRFPTEIGDCPDARPELNFFPEIEAPPAWMEYAALIRGWEQTGVRVESRAAPSDDDLADALLGRDAPPLPDLLDSAPPPVSAETLARALVLNPLLTSVMVEGKPIAPRLRAAVMEQIAQAGPPPDADRLLPYLGAQCAAWSRLTRHPEPSVGAPTPLWQDPRPSPDFKPDTAMLFLAKRQQAAQRKTRADRLISFAKSRFAPHNRVDGHGAESEGPFPPPRMRPDGQGERVLVACMKDEGPYILEWVAYHRTIGFDRILVYTNQCSDGSDRLLDALDRAGAVTHLDNSSWSGQSPQQAALNRAIGHGAVTGADWIAHIDVDEFINIRTGDGTLSALFDAVPWATHFAMTWRLFGHGGVRRLRDRPVIEQFTRCAPSYLPKPHTAWGFKTLGRNLGVYGKLSCHRPTKPDPDRLSLVRWSNGSGHEMGDEVATRGWRSTTRTIGYDLVQLNHYALRSLDAFLVKRQRGRALHVDRSIGENYWMRMDWNDCTETSIQRNLPRLQAAMAVLMDDPDVADAHAATLACHRDRARALRQSPEGRALRDRVRAMRFDQTERALRAMALDVET